MRDRGDGKNHALLRFFGCVGVKLRAFFDALERQHNIGLNPRLGKNRKRRVNAIKRAVWRDFLERWKLLVEAWTSRNDDCRARVLCALDKALIAWCSEHLGHVEALMQQANHRIVAVVSKPNHDTLDDFGKELVDSQIFFRILRIEAIE